MLARARDGAVRSIVHLRIALRNLTRQRRRTLLVLAAIALGVTAVVGVRGFLNGLQSSLVLSSSLAGYPSTQPEPSSASTTDAKRDAANMPPRYRETSRERNAARRAT